MLVTDATTVVIPVEQQSPPPACYKWGWKGFGAWKPLQVSMPFSIDEKNASFFQSVIDNFNTGVETIKKLAQLKTVVLMKGIFAVVMTPFTLASIVKTCCTFDKYAREKKIDAGLALCEQFRRIGENIATLVVSLERIKAIRMPSMAWTKPFAGALAVLSVASIASNMRTRMKVKRLMQEWSQAEERGKQEGKLTLTGYYALLDLIKKKQKEDSDFVSETCNITEEQLENGLLSVARQAEKQTSSSDIKEVEQAQELLDKTAKMLRGRIKQNLTSATVVTISSVINLIGTTLLLLCPVLPIGWIVLGATTLLDGTNWIRHKVVDYQFAKALDIKRTKWEWVIS